MRTMKTDNVPNAVTSQYVNGKVRKITEIPECVTLRYGRQPICNPCGNADPSDHSGPTALRGTSSRGKDVAVFFINYYYNRTLLFNTDRLYDDAYMVFYVTYLWTIGMSQNTTAEQ